MIENEYEKWLDKSLLNNKKSYNIIGWLALIGLIGINISIWIFDIPLAWKILIISVIITCLSILFVWVEQ